MTSALVDGIDRLRQPEYTGSNRCVPCTLVNLMMAAVLAIAVVSIGVGMGAGAVAVPAGVAVLLLSVVAIYLRGYLVPGTPTLTKTYLPDRILRYFDKAGVDEVPLDEFDVETTLERAGAVAECEHEDDLCLTDDFRSAWRTRMDALQDTDVTRKELAKLLDVDASKLSVEDHGKAYVARFDGREAGQWESRAAFVADMAAAREFRSTFPDWRALTPRQRSATLNGLRLFLERCPDCEQPVAPDQDVVESCCRSYDVVTVSCEACGSRLFEVEAPQ